MAAAKRAAAARKRFRAGQLAPASLCTLKSYTKQKVPSYSVRGNVVLYASPDSTYAVTRSVFASAKKSILIGIYDLTAGYVKEWLLQAMQRGVAVALMLDVSLRSNGAEADIFRELEEHGCDAVPAPSCTSRIHPLFHHSHEKVIVVDDRWCFVQSGNYSRSSIPANQVDGGTDASWVPGNRDMGILFDSRSLSRFFTRVLRRDMAVVKAPTPAALARLAAMARPTPLVASRPRKIPKHRPSKRVRLSSSIRVQPVLTPDNYLGAVEKLLARARRSVLIEQQYIRVGQAPVRRLLDAIAGAREKHPDLAVRIIVAGPSFNDDPKIPASLKALAKDYGFRTGTQVRLLNNDYFAHCHNKLIVVDGNKTVISSQNWSQTAVATNREAGVIVPHRTIARYFTSIFDEDWKTALRAYPKKKPSLLAASKLPGGDTIPITLSDYEEV